MTRTARKNQLRVKAARLRVAQVDRPGAKAVLLLGTAAKAARLRVVQVDRLAARAVLLPAAQAVQAPSRLQSAKAKPMRSPPHYPAVVRCARVQKIQAKWRAATALAGA